MTVHIAIANKNETVLFSDSQGSTDRAESHGLHKQFVGENFAVGAAGHAGIIRNLFDTLNDEVGPAKTQSVLEICSAIEVFFEDEVRQKYWDTVEVFVLAPAKASCEIRSFSPGMFSHFGKPMDFATTGSGSEFVSHAMSRHHHLGIDLPKGTLADLLTTTAFFADVANESLTVDDLLAVAIIANGRSYLMGEADVRVQFGHNQLLVNWCDAAIYWETIHAMVTQINSEVRSGQRSFNAIRTGNLIPPMVKQIESSNASIDKLRNQLASKVAEFLIWYDKLVGRP